MIYDMEKDLFLRVRGAKEEEYVKVGSSLPSPLVTRHRIYFLVAIILENEPINFIACMALGVDIYIYKYIRLGSPAFIQAHAENENKAHTFLEQLK